MESLNNALITATKNGDKKKVEQLLSEGADPNFTDSREWSPLHFAAGRGHIEITKVLLNANGEVEKRTNDGRTVLHYAAVGGNAEIIKLLVEAGSNLEAQANNGATPLHYAAVNGNLEAIKLLVEAGSYLDSQANDGRTPLHYAAMSGNVSVLKYLIEAGGSPHAQANNGNTPLDLAKQEHHTEAIDFLSKQNLVEEIQIKTIPTKFQVLNTIHRMFILFQENEHKLLRMEHSKRQLVDTSFKSIQRHAQSMESKINNQKLISAKSSTNLSHHLAKIEELEARLKLLKQQIPEFKAMDEKNQTILNQLELESKKSSQMLIESQKLVDEIKFVTTAARESVLKSKQKIETGDLASLENRELNCLLEELSLGQFYPRLEKSGFKPQILVNIKEKDLMNHQIIKMKFGEARFLVLAIQEILSKKGIPITIDDPSLDIKNVRRWTINNVHQYFLNKKMFEVPLLLRGAKVNGLVLTSLSEMDIEDLNITDISEKVLLRKEVTFIRDQIQHSIPLNDGRGRIMLSYSWGPRSSDGRYPYQEIVKLIAEELEKYGYKTWMDVTEMNQDMVQTMKSVIDNCDAFLACVTNEYHTKDKPANLEFKYAAHHYKQKIFGLKITSDTKMAGGDYGFYFPGSEKYYDMSDSSLISASVSALVKDMKTKGINPSK